LEEQVTISRTRQAGITLMEMLVVTAIIALLAGLTFPSVTAGVDTLRLNAAAESTVSFLNAALNRAERRQQVMEVTISIRENSIISRGIDQDSVRRLDIPDGVKIAAVYPSTPGDLDQTTNIMLYPGGTPPRIGIELVNQKNARRIVRVDPVTGVPQIERPGQEKK
jgi:prepilin-type N-terminal cleavage/methylation domain-containing protein